LTPRILDSLNPINGGLKEVKAMNVRRRSLPRGWYPVDAKECRREIESFLEGWGPPSSMTAVGLGGIVPHAGWYFSGKLAARVYSAIKSKREADLVVLYGGHLGGGNLPQIVTEETWETPFGEIGIHRRAAEALMKKIDTEKENQDSGDNTIEVQVAMVKYFFPRAQLLAVRSPHSRKAIELGEKVAEVAKENGISIVAVGSTDLTHYGPNYGFVSKGTGPSAVEWVKKENDYGFVAEALKMNAEGLLDHAAKHDSACSAGAAAAALTTCKVLGAHEGTLLHYYTSYDIMPDASFVGYAGILY
jgi:AmmeMemoRadiSam system protein B